tara:strand:- start:54 stop:491 length:438 start_codon:yes stop_codon:yes gene_type:complete
MVENCGTCGNDRWPKPSLAVDAVVTRKNGDDLEVLLIRRGNEPWKGAWAFPGGFVELGENPANAVIRELMEETGISGKNPQLLTVRGEPNRDPRKHIVSIFYQVDVDTNRVPIAGDDAAHAEWVDMKIAMKEGMAGDHYDVLENL